MTRIGIDIGGTFTDVVAEVEGRFYSAKVPSTRPNPDEAVSHAIEVILQRSGAAPESVFGVSHGTTVATNAAIEGEFAQVGFLTTAGFADVLAVGRQTREGLYDLLFRSRRILVPANMRIELDERMSAEGVPLVAPEREQVREKVASLIEDGAEVLCVGFLHSYINAEHERQVAEWISEDFPRIPVWTSAEVAPEFREYERFSTAVLDAALGPLMKRYLERFSERVEDASIFVHPLLMHSAGGLATLSDAGKHPTMTLLSGPAAGVLGTIETGQRLNRSELLTFDMGGTSADLSLIHGGKPTMLRLREVERVPVLGNSLDISTIGAGGGSIAWVDSGKRLRVGPRSAGARPGPAAYGHGGTEPTVTDALVLVGLIPANLELGSSVTIHYDAALQAMKTIADELGLDPVGAARAVLDIVNTNMSLTARKLVLERGLDPRDFTLVAFGGAGPMHSVDVARELGIREVLIPATPGTMCALGLLVSDQEAEFVSSQIIELDAENLKALNTLASGLQHEASVWVQEQAVHGGVPDYRLRADMRYRGQHHALAVDLSDLPLTTESLEIARRAFINAHRAQNGYAAEDEIIELVSVRLEASVALPRIEDSPTSYASQGAPADRILSREIEVWWERDRSSATRAVHRSEIEVGSEITGPALVFQEDTTIAVPRGQRSLHS
ncbi:hydantoinase/oxoprolinase family protein [Leucobacter denitrificans]|uniref:Hydantoinase/oxoprolinase family protein n=1 Tax=Leucobacter denitrificans TaxID=683042 RepID=A0A7G9S2P6_9MICO|nr:hydantoinase/oxoprolinase family protein [Leucobacter denitrificans]QNN62121.1 hydantoinase/oxoprolinase family protein [Leucobacter denitrificans]